MARTARQISNLVIDEISLVDKGANQHAVVTIAKNADGENKENEMEIFDEQGNPLDVADLSEGDIVYDAEGSAYSMEFDDENNETYEDYEDDEVEKAWAPRALRRGARGAKAVQDTLPGMSNAALRRGQAGAAMRAGIARGGAARDRTVSAVRGVPGRVRSAAGNARQTVSDGVAGGQAVRALHSEQIRRSPAYAAGMERGARHATAFMNHRGAAGLGVGALAGTGTTAGAYEYNRRRGVKKSFDFADEVREELSKALTDADREEVITKALGEVGYLAEQVEIAKAAAEEERQLRIEREYTEIAKSYNLPFADDELGRVLMHAAEYLPEEDCDIIHKAFEVAGQNVYDEYGLVGGGDNVDVYSQVEEYMDGMVSKSGQSREEMIADAFAANPELYDDYIAGY